MTAIKSGSESDGPLAGLDALRTKFYDRLRSDRALFQQARANHDVEEQGRIAHGLAGLAGTFGFPAIGEAAFALKEQLRQPMRTDAVEQAIATFYAKLDEATSRSD
ncbi:MAG: Hpt domain-containing protein [Pseudomonadota bacterium]